MTDIEVCTLFVTVREKPKNQTLMLTNNVDYENLTTSAT